MEGTGEAMNTIWYKSPAQKWENALAVGNGRLGAMVWGNTGHEIIDINEESVWSKPYSPRNNKNAKTSLKKIRELIKLERNAEAQELLYETFTGLPEESAFYKNAGRVHLDFYDEESYALENSNGVRTNPFENTVFYKRELDLETAIASTTFTKETLVPSTDDLSRNTTGSSITYNREVFVSSQEDVIVIHIWASTPKSIYLRASLENNSAVKKYSKGEDTIALQCFDGIPFSMMMNAVTSSGKISVTGNTLTVERADEVTLFIDVETAFAKKSFAKKSSRGFNVVKLAAWCSDRALKKLCFAANAMYLPLKQSHIAENTALFSKLNLSLGEKPAEEKKTCADDLLLNTDSEEFAELYLKYSRYLLLNSCKKNAKLPPLKNGIFMNPLVEASHVRYDLKGSSSLALTGSLVSSKKCDELIFDLIYRMNKNGHSTTFGMFGMGGVAAFGKTDLWGDTSPCGTDFASSYNPLGFAKLAELILGYYEFTLDRKFLNHHIGIIKSACEFFEEYLVLRNEKTHAVMIPCGEEKEVSGKKYFINEGSAASEKVLKGLFENALKAYNYALIPSNEDFVVKAKDMLAKICAGDCAAEETSAKQFAPSSFIENNFADISLFAEKIISSELHANVLTVKVLDSADGILKTGTLENISLKGNLYANLSWKNGRIISGNLYAKSGSSFIENVVICYQGKKFNARLADGSISLMNILPTTV